MLTSEQALEQAKEFARAEHDKDDNEIRPRSNVLRSRGAARKLLEIANNVEPTQSGRIYIELIKGPFLFREKATPEEYKAGLDLAIERGWLGLHESGTFVRFTRGGADLV
jgi:hypothetical protein